MKKYISILVLAIAFFGSISAQGRCCSSERVLSEFNSIALKSLGHVYLKIGQEQSVRIEADDDIIDKVKTEVYGNELVISIKDAFPEWIQDPKIEIYIVMKEITGLTLSGVGKISSEGIIKTNDLEIRNGGFGNIYLEVEADDVITELSGLGQIILEGKANSNNIRISGAGIIDAKYFQLTEAKIHSSGIGSCTVFATDFLNVKITGLGKVLYKGNPEITREISGIGNLDHL